MTVRGHRRAKGMTLLELTVVILVMLSLATILLLGAQAWKNGSDRTMCILNLQNVQKGVRSYSNMYGQSGFVAGLQDKIIGNGCFVATMPVCPHRGIYDFEGGGNAIPPIGTLYMTCSLSASAEHQPPSHTEW